MRRKPSHIPPASHIHPDSRIRHLQPSSSAPRWPPRCGMGAALREGEAGDWTDRVACACRRHLIRRTGLTGPRRSRADRRT